MIISNNCELIFSHIPGRGGASLRLLLAEHDSSSGRFTAHGEKHPILGELDQ